ncbi:MAG: DUF3794 domain-containing protein [Clostridiales bacterium]|nr:DUF3794 domain-containing protein [Clostridiales bacterium]
MELTKNRITTTNLKAAKFMEFTVDDDFNVPDAKGDIDRFIASKGQVTLEDTEVMENKVRITGVVGYAILYQTDGSADTFECHDGEIPFEETINAEGLEPGDKVSISCMMEDLYVTVINSRKYEVRGLACVKLWACHQVTAEGATGIANGSGIECMTEKVCFTNVVASSRDIMKIKEDVEIPANKPDIGRVLWDDVTFSELESRATDVGVHISGKMDIFVIYKPEDEIAPVQYVNATREFQDTISCDGIDEDMILDDMITMGRCGVSVRANDNGEDRILQVESSLNVDIKVYEDVETDLLKDMFSYSAQVEPVRSVFSYENLLMRNNAKTRVVRKERIKSSQPSILQVVNVNGTVDIDEVKPMDDAVVIEGAVKAAVLYVSSDDSRPLCQMEMVAPFSYRVETVPLRPQDSIRITPALNQITATLPGNDEVEMKAIVDIGMTIFTRKELELIEDMTVAPVDMKKKAGAPGIVGYVVRDGDSIWSIAKQYYSSLDSIRKVNHLETDEIKPGEKLIIVKCASSQ